MGIIQDVVDFITGLADSFNQGFARRRAIEDFSLTDEQQQRVLESDNPSQTYAEVLEEEEKLDPEGRGQDLVDRFFGTFFDAFEDDILEEIEDQGELTPENVEAAVNAAEGAALEDALTLAALTVGIEVAGLGQLETHEEAITQIGSFLALQDVLGRRLGMAMEKGVDPALEAAIAKKTRSEFVALPDAVEVLLRAKTADEGWLSGENVDPRWGDTVGSNEPVNPDNLVEEWGIRDDNLEILERVSLEVMEFEELIETPAELGLIVPPDVLEQTLDLAGYPEDLKDFLRQIPDEIPRSNRAWEERTAVEPTVDELEALVADGEIDPADAVAILPGEVDLAKPALEDRFSLLQDVPAGAPTRSLLEESLVRGYTSLGDLRARLDRLEYDTEKYEDAIKTTVAGDAIGTLQEALALGTISETDAANLMEFAEFDDEAIEQVLAGQPRGDIVTSRLAADADPADRDVETIAGIGSARASGLRAVGIETVGELAASDAQTVSDAARVELDVAQGFIEQARQRIQ